MFKRDGNLPIPTRTHEWCGEGGQGCADLKCCLEIDLIRHAYGSSVGDERKEDFKKIPMFSAGKYGGLRATVRSKGCLAGKDREPGCVERTGRVRCRVISVLGLVLSLPAQLKATGFLFSVPPFPHQERNNNSTCLHFMGVN